METTKALYECIWCPTVFDDDEAFWAHMRAGSCTPNSVNPTQNSPGNPSVKTNFAVETPLAPPPRPSFPPPSAAPTTTPIVSWNSPSTQQQVLPSTNTNSLQSKWMCTLCKVNFTDKFTLMSHVKSREHEEKIITARGPSNSTSSASLPLLQNLEPHPKEHLNGAINGSISANGDTSKLNVGSVSTEFVTEVVRKVVRDELRQMIRSEIHDMFEYMLTKYRPMPMNNSPCQSTGQGDKISPVSSSYSPSSFPPNLKGSFLEYQGNTVQCLACSCSISSPANLQAHLEGKKHKAAMDKYSAVRS